jgi:two-component sensor histidine kinase
MNSSLAPPSVLSKPQRDPYRDIAILAPFGQDGSLLASMLRGVGNPLCVPDVQAFCACLSACAVGVLTREALRADTVQVLSKALRAQPPWSDVPLILLTDRIDPASYSLLAEALGNITIIERPLDVQSLLTIVKTALRARQKQVQVRDLLEAAAEQQRQIQALNDRLKRAMTETHHRVKNSLQIMSALVDIQASEHAEFMPTEKVHQLNMQIRALATVHDVLTQETKRNAEGNTISARTLLQSLLPMLEQLAAPRLLTYCIEETRITGSQGTSLALITNELVLNALKHGQGEVEVSFDVRDNRAVLEVCDDGEGLPEGFDSAAQGSTGMSLLENLATWDLQGTIVYENRPDRTGARVSVTFPLQNGEA